MLLALLFAVGWSAPLVTGVVLDGEGEPVAGVHIDAARVTARGVSHRTDVVSDEAGRFAIPDVDQGPAMLVRVQARLADGQTSEVAFPSRLPADLVLRLRPAADVRLRVNGGDASTQILATQTRDEVLELGALRVYSGDLGEGKLTGPAGAWTIVAVSGERAAQTQVAVEPGQTTTVDLTLEGPGELGLTLPDSLRGSGSCLLSPGEASQAAQGIPTVLSCRDLEPPSMRLGAVAGGEHTLTVVGRDGRRNQWRLEVQSDTWCHFALPEPVVGGLPGGVIGASFDTGSSPARISDVVPGSPAADAGLVAGDLVLAVNRVAVVTGLEALVAIRLSDDAVRLIYGRGGRTKKLKLAKSQEVLAASVPPERCGERPQPAEPERRDPIGLPYNRPDEVNERPER